MSEHLPCKVLSTAEWQDFGNEDVRVVWYNVHRTRTLCPQSDLRGKKRGNGTFSISSTSAHPVSPCHIFHNNQDLEEVRKDEAMRPFFLRVDSPISCPLKGLQCRLCKAWHPALGRQSWLTLEMVPWQVPSSLFPVACSLPALELLLLPLSLQAGRAHQCPGSGSSSGQPPPPHSPSRAAQTRGILQMMLLNIPSGCNSSVCLPLS